MHNFQKRSCPGVNLGGLRCLLQAEPTCGVGCRGVACDPTEAAGGRAWSIRFCMMTWCICAFCSSIISTMSKSGWGRAQ